jgi:Kef-type K+ transport system membrane component KefB
MRELSVLPGLALILLSARLGGELCARLGLPPVFGELLAGFLLGPAGLGWLHPGEELRAAALLGVLLLMFLTGLETDPQDLRETGRGALMAALGGVLLPFISALALGLLAGLSWHEGLFLGAALTATSVGLSVRTLRDLGCAQSRVGMTILGAAVMDDILAMGLLAIVTGLVGLGQPLPSLLRMVGFLVFSFGIGRWLLPPIARWIARRYPNEGGLALVVALVMGMSWAAAAWGGVAAITGAYLTGLWIARTPLREHIPQGVQALGYGLLIPIFFVAVGLEAQPPDRGMLSLFGMALFLLAVLSKWLGSGFGAWLGGLTPREAIQTGAGMVSRGEVALVIATLGRQIGILGPGLYTDILLMTMLTTVLTPLLLRLTFLKRPWPFSLRIRNPWAPASHGMGEDAVRLQASRR